MTSLPRLHVVAPAAERRKAPAWSDEELVRGLQRRDERAAEALYDHLLPVVDHTLRRILHERSPDHDDLVQSVFEQVIRSVVQQRYSQSCSLTTWASVIAMRTAIGALRSRVRERRVFDRGRSESPELWNVPAGPNPERRIEARSDVERLQRALATLAEPRREAVILHDVLGHPLAHVAEVARIGLRAAQSRLFRGRRELLALLESWEKAEGRR